MNIKTINLSLLYPVKSGKLNAIYLNPPFDDTNEAFKRPAIIICPGGAYNFCSKREQEPIATYFLDKGYQVFCLEYGTALEGYFYPEQLYELGASIDYIKKNAKSLYVDENKIFVIGFSAGGHLVGNLSNQYQLVNDYLKTDCKPTAVGLCYAVISAEYGHTQTIYNVTKGYDEAKQKELVELLSLDKLVSNNTPPTFIWTTAEDTVVPPVNSLRYAEALSKNGVKFELHIYPYGRHGLSNCQSEINENYPYLSKNRQWLNNIDEFFKSLT